MLEEGSQLALDAHLEGKGGGAVLLVAGRALILSVWKQREALVVVVVVVNLRDKRPRPGVPLREQPITEQGEEARVLSCPALGHQAGGRTPRSRPSARGKGKAV